VIHVVRMRLPAGVDRGEYDLDAFVIEQVDDGAIDFRFELGRGLGIYWALPAARGDRLRLFEVDGAAYTVDEPVLTKDPFVFDFPRRAWTGELGAIHDGPVTAVAIEVAGDTYRCEVTVGGRELLLARPEFH